MYIKYLSYYTAFTSIWARVFIKIIFSLFLLFVSAVCFYRLRDSGTRNRDFGTECVPSAEKCDLFPHSLANGAECCIIDSGMDTLGAPLAGGRINVQFSAVLKRQQQSLGFRCFRYRLIFGNALNNR